MGLRLDLEAGPIGVDTAVFIYYIEDHPVLGRVVAPLFEKVAAGRLRLVTSGLTLLELLVVPLRAGNQALAQRYEAILTRSPGVELVGVGLDQLRTAAQLRATHPGLRTPDALQLAAAVGRGCGAFLTNDRRLPKIAGLRVLELHDYG